MVTMISQNMSEFEIHLRAILGLPIDIKMIAPAGASYCFHASDWGVAPVYEGVEKALSIPDTKVRIFGKPTTRPKRRMGVTLATGNSIEEARKKAREAADICLFPQVLSAYTHLHQNRSRCPDILSAYPTSLYLRTGTRSFYNHHPSLLLDTFPFCSHNFCILF